MKAAEARRLFDLNAESYDPVNRILSAGLDRSWRRWVAEEAAPDVGMRVLDAMAGTGEVAVEEALRGAFVTAADASPGMLARAQVRAEEAGVDLHVVVTDLTDPTAEPCGPFEAVSISFGLRYVDDKVALLQSLANRMEPGGRLVLLEFCTPSPGLLNSPAGFYFFRILPWLGARLGKGPELYDYLRDSTKAVGTARDLERCVEEAGLRVVRRRTFGFGLVCGIVASAS